jgi:LPXTG-site transpeptidase (sortase) family protein
MVIGTLVLSSNYIETKIEKAFNKMNLQLLAYNDQIERENITEDMINDELFEEVPNDTCTDCDNKNNTKKETPKVTYNYIGKLIIPKLNFERGFVAKDSKYNNIYYGLQLHKISEFPNVSGGNMIFLSHSGNCWQCYFRYLYKLTVGDECYVEYQGIRYKYIIKKIYNKPKIGKIAIDRDYDKTTLTLITCAHDSDTEQTVYIAELV